MALPAAKASSPWDASVVARVVGRALARLEQGDPDLITALALGRLGQADIPRGGRLLHQFVEMLVATVEQQESAAEASLVERELRRRLGPVLSMAPPSRTSGIRAKELPTETAEGTAGARPTLPVAEPLAPFQRVTVPSPPGGDDEPPESA